MDVIPQPSPMARRDQGSVLDCAAVTAAGRRHPTEKPVDLVRRLIRATKAETVLDPFMGSGTTGVAAVRESRDFVGIEIEPKHFNTAFERIRTEGAPMFK